MSGNFDSIGAWRSCVIALIAVFVGSQSFFLNELSLLPDFINKTEDIHAFVAESLFIHITFSNFCKIKERPMDLEKQFLQEYMSSIAIAVDDNIADRRFDLVELWRSKGWLVPAVSSTFDNSLNRLINTKFSFLEIGPIRRLFNEVKGSNDTVSAYDVGVIFSDEQSVRDVANSSNVHLTGEMLQKVLAIGNECFGYLNASINSLHIPKRPKFTSPNFGKSPPVKIESSTPVVTKVCKKIRKIFFKAPSESDPDSFISAARDKEQSNKESLCKRICQVTVSVFKLSSLPSLWKISDPNKFGSVVADSLKHRNPRNVEQKLKFLEWIVDKCSSLDLDINNLNQADLLELMKIKQKESNMQMPGFTMRLRWVNLHFGLKLPEVDPIIKQACINNQIKHARKVGKASTPCPHDVQHLEWQAVHNPLKHVRIFCAKVCVCIKAGLRVQDAQRSVLCTISDESIRGYAYTSKNASLGTNAPSMQWAATTAALNDSAKDWYKCLYEELFTSDCMFQALSTNKVASSSILVKNLKYNGKTCSTKKIVDYIHEILNISSPFNKRLSRNFDKFAVMPLRGHSLRHFMATAADLMSVDPDRSAPLGRWRLAKRSQWSQARAYSNERLTAALQTQSMLINVIKHVTNKCNMNKSIFSWLLIDPSLNPWLGSQKVALEEEPKVVLQSLEGESDSATDEESGGESDDDTM
jgi:hypothetical protein